jgi:hypothetical protein
LFEFALLHFNRSSDGCYHLSPNEASLKGRQYEKKFTLQFGACQSIISLALINFKFKFAYSLSTPVLCPNRRYLDEIGIGRGDWYFVDYKGFSFH